MECGERRGQSRFPFADSLAQRTQAAPPQPPRKGLRLTANSALIAGVGTLLLAMGVGVLIGRSGGNASGSKSSAAQIIRVPASSPVGTAGAAGITPASTTGSGGDRSKKSAKGSGGGKSKKPLSAQTVQPKGSTAPPPAVKIGSPGHGKGYKNGKFTGQFFGQ